MPDIAKQVYNYLVDHQGKCDINRCAAELHCNIDDVKSAVAALQESGKIKKSGGSPPELHDQLLQQKKRLKHELENLSSQLSDGYLTSTQYEINSSAVSKKIERVDRKLKALRKSKRTAGLPEPDPNIRPEAVAELIKKRDAVAAWIDNLNNRKDSVSESAYENLMAEYNSRLDTLKASITESVGKLLNLWEENKNALEALTSGLEDLNARTISGEIEERYSRVKREEMEHKIRQITQEIELIETILSKTGS